MELSQDAEEVATFYARMIEHEYTTMEAFNKNFFKDWQSVMTHEEKNTITNLKKCDFTRIHRYFQQKSEERKAMSKEEKKVCSFLSILFTTMATLQHQHLANSYLLDALTHFYIVRFFPCDHLVACCTQFWFYSGNRIVQHRL